MSASPIRIRIATPADVGDADKHSAEAMEAFSTLSAVDFYGALGFGVIEETEVELAPGLALPSVLMRRPKFAM